jgi:hypothetical protein
MKLYEELYNFCYYKYQGDEMKKDEMGGECGMHGKGKKCIPNFSEETRKEESVWEISHRSAGKEADKEINCGHVDWIHLSQGRVQLWDLVDCHCCHYRRSFSSLHILCQICLI